jgi:hypothetical protein
MPKTMVSDAQWCLAAECGSSAKASDFWTLSPVQRRMTVQTAFASCEATHAVAGAATRKLIRARTASASACWISVLQEHR